MPALMRLVGAVPGAGFSMNAVTRPSLSVTTTPNRLGSSTGVKPIVVHAPRCGVERDQRRVVNVGQHVAVDDDEALRNTGFVRRVRDRPAGVERFSFHDVANGHARASVIGIRLEKRVGLVAHRKYDVVNAVRREVTHDAFEHRNARNRQQLLRCCVGQRPKSCALAADEDDGFHGAEVGGVLVGVAAVVRCHRAGRRDVARTRCGSEVARVRQVGSRRWLFELGALRHEPDRDQLPVLDPPLGGVALEFLAGFVGEALEHPGRDHARLIAALVAVLRTSRHRVFTSIDVADTFATVSSRNLPNVAFLPAAEGTKGCV